MAIKPGTEISVNKKGSSVFKEGDEISPISSSKSNLQNQQQNAVKTASRYQAMTVHEKRLLEEEEKLRKKQVPTEHEIILASAKSKKKSGETLTKKENIVLDIEKSKLNLDTQTLKALSDQADNDYNIAKINELKGADSSASYSALSRKNTLNMAYKNSLMTDITNTATESVDFNTKSVADKNIVDNDYKYINDINGFRNSSKSAYDKATTLHATSADTAAIAAAVKFVSQSTKPSYMDSNYEYMKDEEIRIYNYYFNKGQKSRAKEYLSLLKDTLQKRANGEIEENMTDLAKTSKVGASVLSVATNVGSALQQGINTIKYLGTGEMDTNDYALMTSTLRKGVTDQVDWTIGNWDAFDFIYNTGMSGVDSLIMAPAGSAGAVMLGLSAAASTSNDVLERGGTSSQAFWSGLMAGAAEAVFEKISIGQLNVMKDSAVESVLDVVKNYGKAMLTNASEEALTEIANIGTDYLINGGISQYSLLVSEYIANGETTASAKRKASQQMVNQVLEAGASGAFMGLGFATLGTGISYARDTATHKAAGKAIVANGQENFIIQKALELNPKSVAYKLANEIQSSGKLNNQKLGKLSFEIKSEINNSINKKITASVSAQIDAADISADERQELSLTFKKAISGDNLSSLENKILSDSEVASKISSDLASRTAPWVKSLDTQLEQNRSDFNLINSAMNLSLEKLAENLPNADANTASPVSVNENSNLTQEQKNLNAVLSAATSGMNRNQGLQSAANDDIITSRGDIDGSTNSELLERGRVLSTTGEVGNGVRQRGGNPTANSRMLGDVVKRQRGNDRTISAGESGWMAVQKYEPDTHKSPRLRESLYRRLSRINLKKTDSAGRVLSDDLIAELNDTIFKDENGKIISLFHWTPNIFDVFKYGDIGFHLGTLRAALDIRKGSEQFLKDDSFVGTSKEVYCNMKKPVFMKDYTGIWEVYNAKQLVTQGIITQAEYDALKNLQGFRNSQYSDEASVKFRELLESKDYDGIIYINEHEDLGSLSVIAFHPEQIITVAENGVLKENSGVTEATSDTEVASFVPENEQGEVFESGEENNTPETQNPVNEEFKEEFEENRPTFREPSAREIAREASPEEKISSLLGETMSLRQRQVNAIAEKFGLTIRWTNKIPLGTFNPKTNTISMNPDTTVTEAYIVILKHEWMHYLENRKEYKAFKDYLFADSVVFEDYIRGCLKKHNGEEFIGSREEAIEAYTEIIFERRKNAKEIPSHIREGYTTEKIEREIVADFCGDVLIGADNIEESERALNEIAQTHRNFIQRIIDFISDWIDKIRGEAQNRTLKEDLEYLNARLARVYDSKAQKNTTKDGDVKYAINEVDVAKINVEQNLINIAEMESVFELNGEEFKKGEKDLITQVDEYFATFDHSVVNSILGDVDITARGAKDSISHGIGRNKAMAFAAVPSVIKNGQIIDYQINWKNRGYDTVVLAAPITVKGVPYYEGVIVLRDSKTQRFYVHEIITEKRTDMSFKTGADKIGSSGNISSPSIISLLAKIQNVKENIAKAQADNSNYKQESENNSDEIFAISKFDFAAEMQTLNDKLKSGEITAEEFIRQVNKISKKETAVSDKLRAAIEEIRKENKENKKKLTQNEKTNMRLREKANKSHKEAVEEAYAMREERATRQKNIEYIRREVRRMDTAFRTNSDTKNVPENLKDAIGGFIKIFAENDRSPFDKKNLALIHLAYSGLGGDISAGGETVMSTFDPQVERDLNILSSTLDGKTLRDLSYGELIMVRNIVDNFKHMLSAEKEMMVAGKKYEIEELGNSIIRDLSTKKATREFVTNRIYYEMLTPAYFFKHIGGPLAKIASDIFKGQGVWYRNMEFAKTYIAQIKEECSYDESWKTETLTIETEQGETLKLTIEQALLLYTTARREYSNKAQNSEHLFRGGVVLDTSKNFEDKVKSFIQEFKNSKDKPKFLDAFCKKIDSRAHQITPLDAGRVREMLTENQIKYADKMVEYLSNDMAVLGNEVSIRLFGIKKYTENYYIPYNSARNFLASQPGVTSDVSLKHQSFTHNTQYKANNPLVLSSFSEVCAGHIEKMCMYNAMALPVDNLTKMLNWKTVGKEGLAPKSIRAELERTYGKEAVKYLEQFIVDINGNMRSSGMEDSVSKLHGKAKMSQVAANASVVVQQYSSIVRATSIIPAKYFVSTISSLAEKNYEQLKKYSSVAGIKEMGRFDTGVGVTNTKWLLDSSPVGITDSVKTFVKDSSYRKDVFGWAAGKMDELAWGHIWAAVKSEIKDTTGLKPGTKEFFEAAGERFDEVINFTQVYDSTLSRSQIMRDKGFWAKSVTAFMSEPTITFNMVCDAVFEIKSNGKAGRKKAGAILSSVVMAIAINNVLKSFITAARDDDEDESYLEKYIAAFVNNFISDLNPLNYIPVIRDLLSMAEGYTPERAELTFIGDIITSGKKLLDGENTEKEYIDFLSSVAVAFDIPLKNIIRDLKAAENTFTDIFMEKNDTTATGIKYAITEPNNSQIYADMVNAINNGNEEEYQRIYDYLIEIGKDESKIRSGIKSAFKESKSIISKTEKYIGKLEGNKTFESFDEESQEGIKKNIADALAKEKTVKAITKNGVDYDALYEAQRRSKSAYKKARQDILDKGVSEGEIEDGLFVAKIKYMKSVGIDVHEYMLYKMATNKAHADTDGSGGVSNAEKRKAISKIDVDDKTKAALYRNMS